MHDATWKLQLFVNERKPCHHQLIPLPERKMLNRLTELGPSLRHCTRTYHALTCKNCERQEAHLSPSDRAMRLVCSNLANYDATVQKLLIRQVLTKPMV